MVERDAPEAALSAILKAASDPSRRRILTLLVREGPMRVTDLARFFDLSLNAVSKHIKVLEAAGLVSRMTQWREHVIAAELGPTPRMEDVLRRVPRLISINWWQVYPDAALALFRRAPVSVELPTGPARRIAIRGEGVGFFVHSAVADDIAAGRLAEIRPVDVDQVHRDIAMVVRDESVIERDMLHDFVKEIARECEKVGTLLETRLELGA